MFLFRAFRRDEDAPPVLGQRAQGRDEDAPPVPGQRAQGRERERPHVIRCGGWGEARGVGGQSGGGPVAGDILAIGGWL